LKQYGEDFVMRRIEVPEIWVKRINEYKAREEPAPVWCERNQVTQGQLYYWMDRLNKANQQALLASRPQFIPLCLDEPVAEVAQPPQPEHQVCEASPVLVRVGSATVEVGPGIALEGPADSLLCNPLVQEAYLGAD
jgi:transposase-like protein